MARMGGRNISNAQLYRFPVMMGGILAGIITFWWTFSSVNAKRIKQGSKRFTDSPEVTFKAEK